MDPDEIKRRLSDRIDRDANFAHQIGGALEAGAWEIITRLIAEAVGFVVDLAKDFFAWLKREFG